MFGDAFCSDDVLWVRDIGQRQLRVLLLSLEPGSRLWLSLDGQPVQFERLPDGEGQNSRGYRPVGATAAHWHKLRRADRATYIEDIAVIERPADQAASDLSRFETDDA